MPIKKKSIVKILLTVACYLCVFAALLHPPSSTNTDSSQWFFKVAAPLVLVLFFVWRISQRFRRMVGRQRLSPTRSWTTLFLYPALLLLLALASLAHPAGLWWLVGGITLGIFLGQFGLSRTSFEPTKEGLFYTPHAHIGIALTGLFSARVGYRLVQIYSLRQTVTPAHDDFAYSPLTLSVFGLLAGYYVTYAIGLLRWRSRILRAKRQREQSGGNASKAQENTGS